MMWVGSGSVKVKVRDHNGREQTVDTLYEGAHFGEISVLYECKRSASVISSNYQTLCRLIRPKFQEVISEFPEWETCLKNNAIKSYNDKKMQFVMRMIKRVEYLEKHDDAVLFDLMYNLESMDFEKDTVFLAEDQARTEAPTNALYFVEDGELEVYTKFEGSEFVIDQLHKGSVVN